MPHQAPCITFTPSATCCFTQYGGEYLCMTSIYSTTYFLLRTFSSILRLRPNRFQTRCTANGPVRCTVSPFRPRTTQQQREQSGVRTEEQAEETQSELGRRGGSRRPRALRNQYRGHTLLQRLRIRTNRLLCNSFDLIGRKRQCT